MRHTRKGKILPVLKHMNMYVWKWKWGSDGGEWSGSYSGHITPEGKDPGAQFGRMLGGPQIQTENIDEKKNRGPAENQTAVIPYLRNKLTEML